MRGIAREDLAYGEVVQSGSTPEISGDVGSNPALAVIRKKLLYNNSLKQTGYTISEVIIMEKKENFDKEKNVSEELDTFNNHWGTGHFLGPNTLRYEENTEIYEKEDGE